jgi:hypothetical protein
LRENGYRKTWKLNNDVTMAQSPNKLGIKLAGLCLAIFMPLMPTVLSNPPLAHQPWLGIIQFSYLVACYFVLWVIWKRTNDYRVRMFLLVLFIFLPDYLWIMNVSPLLPERGGGLIVRAVAGFQLIYLFGGYFVFKYLYSTYVRSRADSSTNIQTHSDPSVEKY